jgi:hypothetical protein
VEHGANASIEGTSKTPHEYEVILRTMLEPTATRLNGVLVGSAGSNMATKDGTRYWWNPSSFELHVVFLGANFKLDVDGIRTSLY